MNEPETGMMQGEHGISKGSRGAKSVVIIGNKGCGQKSVGATKG